MLSSSLVLLFYATVVMGAGNKNITFLFPSAPLTLNYMDTVNVTYTSPFPKPILYTMCTKANSKTPLRKNSQPVPAKNSSALANLGWSDVISCYFEIRPSAAQNDDSKAGTSDFIRVLADARPTPILVGLEQDATTVPYVPSNVVTVTAVPKDDGGLGEGAKIGIGVGVALGVVLIAAAVFAVFLLRKRRRSKMQATGQLLGVDDESTKSDPGSSTAQSVPMKPIPMERETMLEAPHELPSERTYEIGSESNVGELSADSRLEQSKSRRFSWERAHVS